MKWAHGHQFIGKLTDRGFHQIGAGCFSTVLAKKGSDRVIKVSRTMDPWLDYVVWAAKHGHNGSLAPLVYSYRRFNEGTPNEFYVAVVERLQETMNEARLRRRALHDAYLSLASHMRCADDDEAKEAEREIPGAIQFADSFREAFRDFALDLHANNWMLRANGSLVCIDPFYDGLGVGTPSRMRHRDLTSLSTMREAA
jgi:hypothetical protein